MQPAHIKKVLLKHLGISLCEAVAGCTDGTLEPVKRFVQMATTAGDSIVSFNWDLLVEAVAADLDVAVSYGGIILDGLPELLTYSQSGL